MYQYHRCVFYLPLHSNLIVFVGMEIIMKKKTLPKLYIYIYIH